MTQSKIRLSFNTRGTSNLPQRSCGLSSNFRLILMKNVNNFCKWNLGPHVSVILIIIIYKYIIWLDVYKYSLKKHCALLISRELSHFKQYSSILYRYHFVQKKKKTQIVLCENEIQSIYWRGQINRTFQEAVLDFYEHFI